MNKIYRTLWDASLKQPVTASELAATHGAGSSSGSGQATSPRTAGSRLILSLAALLLAIGLPDKSTAAPCPGGVEHGQESGADVTACGKGSVAIGNTNNSEGEGSTTLGYQNDAKGQGSFAAGQNNKVNGLGTVSMGLNNVAQGKAALVIGGSSQATGDGTTVIGNGSKASGEGSTVIGSGSQATGGDGSTVIGDNSQATAPGSSVFGDDSQATAKDAQIYGNGSKATGESATVLGNNSQAGTKYALALGDRASASAQEGDVALGVNSSTAAVVATANTTINGTAYSFAGANPTSTVSIGTAGSNNAPGLERTLTNVAAGRISATSTDAINGSQLHATNSAINNVGSQVTNLGNSLASGLGGGSTYNSSTGALTTNLSYGGNTYHSVQNVLDQISSGGGGGGGNVKYFHVNSTLADSTATGSNSVAIGPVSTAGATDAVSIGNGATASANAGDVALGAGSVTSPVVATPGTTLSGTSYSFAGANPTSTVSVGSVGKERTLTNVAAGRITATSTDAVNGSQLYATNQEVSANTTAINNLSSGGSKYLAVNATGNHPASATGANSAAVGSATTASGANSTALGNGASASGTNSVALGAGSTDGGRANVVSVGSPTAPRQISNVGAGTAPTDAVNVGQLKQGVQAAQNWAQNYTDQKLAGIQRDLHAISTRANAGIAASIAMSSLGQAYQPNQSTVGVGVGTYHGEAGVAVGLSTITESGRYIFKLAASSSTRGDVGVGGSVNMVW